MPACGRCGRAPAAVAELPPSIFNPSTVRLSVLRCIPNWRRGTALVAFVLFQHGCNESAFEFAHRFGIKNIAAIHLLYECFELVFHRRSLFVCRMV
jgi:hypothetical protein